MGGANQNAPHYHEMGCGGPIMVTANCPSRKLWPRRWLLRPDHGEWHLVNRWSHLLRHELGSGMGSVWSQRGRLLVVVEGSAFHHATGPGHGC